MRLSVVALLLTLGLVPATAQSPQSPEPPRAGLRLSEDQKKQMEALRAKHKDAIEAKRKALDESRKAFHEAARKPEATPESLKPLHQALSEKQFDLMQTQRSMRMAQRELLSPEQRERAERMRGRVEGLRMGRRMEQAPRPGMPGRGRMEGAGRPEPGFGMRPGRGEGPGMRARGPEGAGHPGPGFMAGRMAERLGLDEGQRKALKELREKQRAEGMATQKRLQESRRALTEAAQSPATKAEELKKLHQGLAEAQFQAMTERRSHRQAMEKLLTPEQREKVQHAMKRQAGFRGRR